MSWGEIKKKCLQQTLPHSHSAIEDVGLHCTERNKRSFHIELTSLSLSHDIHKLQRNYKETYFKVASYLANIYHYFRIVKCHWHNSLANKYKFFFV